MDRSKRSIAQMASAVFCTVLLSTTAGVGDDASTTSGLFTPASAPPGSGAADGDHIARARFVEVDFDVLREALTPGDGLELGLFEDAVLVATLDQLDTSAPDRLVWVGHVEGVSHSSAILVVVDSVLVASVVLPSESYQVRYAEDGVHVIQQINPSGFPEEKEPIPVPRPVADSHDDAADGVALDDGSEFDVLVVYTPAARIAAGGTAAIRALITLGETETNLAYSNSGVIPRLRVVQTAEVSYSESVDIGLDLARLRAESDGFMDDVHDMRDTSGADLVKLIVNSTSGGCGVAYLMCGQNPNFGSSAFSVTARTCVSPNYTFAHELGHNMGSNHAPGDPTGCGAFSYSFGYKDPLGSFRTVMAYNCVGGCTRVLHFSNPSVNYFDRVTGTVQQNNAESINNVRMIVANFRGEVCPSTVVLQGTADQATSLETLYRFRDEVLSRTAYGQYLIELFYRHAREGTRILVQDPELLAQTRQVLAQVLPKLRASAEGGVATLSFDDVEAVAELLEAIADKGSGDLSWTARWLHRALDRPRLLAPFGLDIPNRTDTMRVPSGAQRAR